MSVVFNQCPALEGRKPSSCVGGKWWDNQNRTLNLGATDSHLRLKLTEIHELLGQNEQFALV